MTISFKSAMKKCVYIYIYIYLLKMYRNHTFWRRPKSSGWISGESQEIFFANFGLPKLVYFFFLPQRYWWNFPLFLGGGFYASWWVFHGRFRNVIHQRTMRDGKEWSLESGKDVKDTQSSVETLKLKHWHEVYHLGTCRLSTWILAKV